MRTKEFSAVIVLLSLAGIIRSTPGLALKDVNLPSDFMPKYMKQNIQQDLEKLSLLDQMLDAPAPKTRNQKSAKLAKASQNRKLQQKSGASLSRKLEDHEGMLNSLYDNLYPGDDSLGLSDSTSCKIIS
jgi:hypothetical protein